MNDFERLKKVVLYLASQGYIDSQEDLAAKMKINVSYLSQIVNGKKPISKKFVDKLTQTYQKINSSYILSGSGSMINDHAESLKNNPELNLISNVEYSEMSNENKMFIELMKAIERRDEFLEKQQNDFNDQIRLLTSAIERRDNMALNQQETHKEQVDRLISLLENTIGARQSDEESSIDIPLKKRNPGLEKRP